MDLHWDVANSSTKSQEGMGYPDGGVQQAIGNMGLGPTRELDVGVIYTQDVVGGHDLLKYFKHINCVFYFL